MWWHAIVRHNRARTATYLATLNSHAHAVFLQHLAHTVILNPSPISQQQHRSFAIYKAGWYRPPDPFIPSNLSTTSLLDQFVRLNAARGPERDTQLIKLFDETQERAPTLATRELAQLLEVSGKLSGPKSSIAVRTAARATAAALVRALRARTPEERMDLVDSTSGSSDNFAKNLIEGLRWIEALTAEQAWRLAEEVLVQVAPRLRQEQLAECLETLAYMTSPGELVNTSEFVAQLQQRIPSMNLQALAQTCLYVYRCTWWWW